MAMKWKNLLKNKCPKCGRGTLKEKNDPGRIIKTWSPEGDSHEIAGPKTFACSGKKCDFGIGEARFKEICIRMTSGAIDREYNF